MKRLFACLILTALLLSGCGVLDDPELQSEIQKIIEENEREIVTVYYHDLYEVRTEYADGRTARQEYTYSEEAQKWLLQYTGCIYYENGQEVGREEYVRDEWDSVVSILTERSTTTFDLTYEDYRVVKKVIFVNGEETGHEEYAYNDQGLLTETRGYQDGTLTQRTVTEYGPEGRRTKITRYDGAGTVTGYDVCEFDKAKYKETLSRYDAGGILLGYWINSFDIHFNIIQEEAYSPEGGLISTTYRRIGTGSITGDIENLRTGRSIKRVS